MLVRDVMTSPAITVGPADGVAAAARILDDRSLTSLPVVDEDGRLVGVVGEFDLIGLLTTSPEIRAGGHVESGAPRVGDVMSQIVLTVAADDDLAEFVAIMSSTALKSLPVLLHGRVAGVISRRDVIRAVARGDLAACPTVASPTG